MERSEREKFELALGLFLKKALLKVPIGLLPGALQGLLEAVDEAYREASNDPRVRVHEIAGVLAEGAFSDAERGLVAERVARAVLRLDPASLRTVDLKKVSRELFPEPPFPEEGLSQLAYRVAEEFLRWYLADPEIFAQVGRGVVEGLERRFSELVEEREREREAERLRVWDGVVGPLFMTPPSELGLSVRVLSARFGLVPFSKVPLFDVILNRVESGSGVAVLQVEGQGGVGKTRLLQEVGKALIARGWRGGVLRGRRADLERIRRLFEQAEAPLFFLVDYAGTRVHQVRDLLSAAASVGWERPLVVLLAERYSLEKELKSKLFRDDDRVGLDAWLWARGVDLGSYELPPLDRETAVRVYEGALRALAEFAGEPLPEVGEPPPWDRPLYLALDALLRLAGRGSEHGGRKDRLLEDALNYEQGRWHRFWEAVPGVDKDRARDALDLLVAAAVLADGLSRREAAELWRREPLREYETLRASVENAAFSAIGGARGERLSPLEPDPVADALLGKVGTERLRPLLGALFEAFSSALEDEALLPRVESAVAVLRRAGIEEHDERGLLLPWEFFLAQSLSTLGPEVFDRAARLLQKVDPNHPLLVRPVHLVLAGAMVLRAQAAGDPKGLAWSLGTLGLHLAALGRHEEALKAAEEAVAHYRALVERNPEAFLPELARSLTNLGNHLAALGRPEEAFKATEEAVEIYRALVERYPEAFLPELAASLNNLGNHLAALGRPEEAFKATEEAVEIYRALAERNREAFLPELAASLDNLGNHLAALGRPEEAFKATEEAVEIYRALVERNLEAFLPELAASLNNLGNRLADLGRPEEAFKATEEAVAHYRALVERRPEAFLPELAMSLTNLGAHLADLGRPEEAFKAAEEAVEIYRALAERNLEAFLPELAASLNNLGNRLADLGRHEEALKATEEAVEIRRALVERNSEAFLPELARSLGLHGSILQEIRRYEDALSSAREGIEVLAAHFLRFPQAFGGLMSALLWDYMRAVSQLRLPLDSDLLCPLRKAKDALRPELAEFLQEICEKSE